MCLDDAISVSATGVSITLGAASAGSALPTCLDGSKPRYIRLATTTAAFVRVGNGAQTAVATDLLVLPGFPTTLKVTGQSHIAALQAGTAGILIVTPLEDK